MGSPPGKISAKQKRSVREVLPHSKAHVNGHCYLNDVHRFKHISRSHPNNSYPVKLNYIEVNSFRP